MKRRVGLFAVLGVAGLFSATVASAQFGLSVVKDPWNLVENVEQVRSLWKQIQRMDRDLEKIPDRLYRDLSTELEALLAAAERGTLSWVTPGVGELFADFYGAVAITPELRLIADAQDIQKDRAGAALSTLAASVGSVGTQVGDYRSVQEHLKELKRNAGKAHGNVQALEVLAMYQDVLGHELVKLNQAMGALVSAQNVASGYEISERATFEATVNLGIDSFVDREIPVYDGMEGEDGIPDDWPYVCFGCN